MALSRSKAREEVSKLGNWTLRRSIISRKFVFANFAQTMRFVNMVARLAEAANHHPDITINYNRVKLALTTHDEGGLTMKDFRLAGRVNKFVK
ncbi:MAG: 4a-hydroxytetrahydrobiopterin dehydratase [Candidatus Bathyarchaeia archaeon]